MLKRFLHSIDQSISKSRVATLPENLEFNNLGKKTWNFRNLEKKS